MKRVVLQVALLASIAFALSPNESTSSRRDALKQAFAGGVAVSSVFLLSSPPVNAFANKISDKYDDRPKRRGPQVRAC